MKKFLPTCCIILLPFFVHAEYLIRGKVSDEQDRPIPFVNVGFVGTSIGTVSSMEGEFRLYFAEMPDLSIPLRISCMGFEPIEVMLTEENFEQPLHFGLKENPIQLQEAVVKSGALHTKTYGNEDEKTAIKTNLAISSQPGMNLGAEIGRKFRLGDEPNFVSSLKFFVAFNNFDSLMIRVNFYELESGKPAKVLNAKPILREVLDHKSGWVTFDLEDENLVLSGSIVASIEWVGASKRGNAFGLNISMPAIFQTHYYKYGAQNSWKVFPNMSSSMVLVVERED
ncbi:carboxypeptidase-like regulatory domain-containing protein [Algoriphagus confluentis]|uniref:Carboxypeptidase-like regulatory domain-containing protein n=1 Tax=Algoriphagus confluentis TaxID=1697556 RepID=A0ABQ6PP54_9BACT|nr:hypothetical protein Aconfl_24020 [Algoriphagus confluentis]